MRASGDDEVEGWRKAAAAATRVAATRVTSGGDTAT